MALSARSLINYGIEVTELNCNLDFKADSGGPELNAVLQLGFYSVNGIALAIEQAMKDVDPANSYIVTANFNLGGGTQNRITIATTGTYLSLLFATGTNTTTNCASLIGFNPLDYTGATTYTGSQSTGTNLIPDYIAWNFLGVDNQAKLFGAVNISAAGTKESTTFNTQYFLNMEFRIEPKSKLPFWKEFFLWAIQQRPFDYIPEITDPDTNFQVTLENTDYDGKGLGFRMKEMLPLFPNYYQTGPLTFRVIFEQGQFL